ncbi:hypothetical protein [Burkholderia vietnamiensis]|uniref:hypothetical protein n=1 Tax=Burkholderia vietnamiensis TaxID=60552 RepID=UPI000AE3D461|nr:hypothetical protein [Burkholderia vietnamiensis]
MNIDITGLWSQFKAVNNIVGIVTAFVSAVFGALIGAGVALWNTRKTLAIQQLVSNRATASFIADKRQKWIDELRADVATHLAESQELVWKWDATRQRAAAIMADEALLLHDRAKQAQALLSEFHETSSDLVRAHRERHHRLRFRLNPEELNHRTLRDQLDEMRTILDNARNVENKEVAIALLRQMERIVAQSDLLTSKILKTEWERVKQEVAYPAEMIERIPRP